MTSTECRQEVATNLLKLFLGQGLAKGFLDLLFQLELSRTSEARREGPVRVLWRVEQGARDSRDAGMGEISEVLL